MGACCVIWMGSIAPTMCRCQSGSPFFPLCPCPAIFMLTPRIVVCLLVCTGFPSFALSSNKLNSFLAISELGYVCCKVPLLNTTSSAVYGLLIPSYRGLCHHACTSLTCWSNRASSASPALEASASNWNESDGSAEDTGGETVGNAEDMYRGVVQSARVAVEVALFSACRCREVVRNA